MKRMIKLQHLLLLLLSTSTLVARGQNTTDNSKGLRGGKLFSLFSVVNFPNDECITSDGLCGTCLTASECTSRSGGVASGNCASGFGTCCLIFQDTCGGTISNNRTYIRNPGYSSTYNTAGTCTWTFEKSQTDICQIRLDFDEFSISAPSVPATTQGDCSTVDRFQGFPVTGTSTPLICGENGGQHIYLDAGADSTSSATLTATILGNNADLWNIKVSMIECSSDTLPPSGCLQYHTGVTGQVRSFNFDAPANAYSHLLNQEYQTCVRRQEGYCSIGWQQSNDPDSFKLGRPAPNFNSLNSIGLQAQNQDYVVIPNGSDGGSRMCIGTFLAPAATDAPTPTIDRYGGGSLNCIRGSANPTEIISETVPFTLGVFMGSQENALSNRGFCLNYRQILCC